MEMHWTDEFKIHVRVGPDTVTVSANREGLLSLAGHLSALAEGMPGDHFHLDAYNSLEEGSAELIVEKIE